MRQATHKVRQVQIYGGRGGRYVNVSQDGLSCAPDTWQESRANWIINVFSVIWLRSDTGAYVDVHRTSPSFFA